MASRPDRSGKFLVRFEGGSTMRLYRQTVEDFGLYAGLELSDGQMDALCTQAGAMSAKMRAVRIVCASNVSRRDLEQRLVRKGETPDQAREAVEWMEDLNLLDDREMARQLMERCAARGYGIGRAKQMLYEKQIPRELWEEALADYPDQKEHITAFLAAHLDENSDQRAVKRTVDSLIRRGHSYGAIQNCLRQLRLDGVELESDQLD